MMFNLTPTILVEDNLEAVETALESLQEAGTDSEWVEILRSRYKAYRPSQGIIERLTCEHGSLTAACYEAACRPPTSGGTGGSRRKGVSPPGFKIKPTPSRKTEFGQKIKSMIDRDPQLNGLARSVIEDSYAERIEAQRKADLESVRFGFKVRSSDGTFEVASHSYRSIKLTRKLATADDFEVERGTDKFRDEANQFESVNKLVGDSKTLIRLLDPGFKPSNKAEEQLHSALLERLKSDDPYETIVVPTDFGSIRIAGVGRPEFLTKFAEVDGLTELSVTKVGHAIRDEILVRTTLDHNPDKEFLNHSTAMNEIEALIKTVDPEITSRDFIMQTYADGRRDISVFGVGGTRSSLTQDHPVRKQIIELIESRGIYSTDWTQQAALALTVAHNKIVSDVMSEIRPMGGEFATMPRQSKVSAGLSTRDQVIGAAAKYPHDWIAASNLGSPVQFRQTTGRAHYKDDARTRSKYGRLKDPSEPIKSRVTLDGSHNTAVHEVAHRMEQVVPGVRELEGRFYLRRTEGSTSRHMGKGYGADEWTKPDEFFSPYVGKGYAGKAYEIMSMGTEALQSYSKWNTVDSDYQAFVLGTLATAYRG